MPEYPLSLSSPVVSICLPCLNTFTFLAECLDSLSAQAINWELVACDGFSTDGSWELLQDFCHGFPSRNCFQSSVPLYEAWNMCIRRATGKYIYIATSDDVLGPSALQLMVAALEAEPRIGLCQIRLQIIDQHSSLLPAEQQWEYGRLSQYDSCFISQPNRRVAPHDGVLMSGFHSVYESINQLLIRREVFERVGLFDQCFGAAADFEWAMRVGLTQNCVYLPEPVAYWRKHAAQLTQPAFTASERLHALAMTRSAFSRAQRINPSLRLSLLQEMEDLLYDDYLSARSPVRSSSRDRLRLLISELLARPGLLVRRLIRSLRSTTTTTFDYPRKRVRLLAIIRKHQIPLPQFTS